MFTTKPKAEFDDTNRRLDNSNTKTEFIICIQAKNNTSLTDKHLMQKQLTTYQLKFVL